MGEGGDEDDSDEDDESYEGQSQSKRFILFFIYSFIY